MTGSFMDEKQAVFLTQMGERIETRRIYEDEVWKFTALPTVGIGFCFILAATLIFGGKPNALAGYTDLILGLGFLIPFFVGLGFAFGGLAVKPFPAMALAFLGGASGVFWLAEHGGWHAFISPEGVLAVGLSVAPTIQAIVWIFKRLVFEAAAAIELILIAVFAGGLIQNHIWAGLVAAVCAGVCFLLKGSIEFSHDEFERGQRNV